MLCKNANPTAAKCIPFPVIWRKVFLQLVGYGGCGWCRQHAKGNIFSRSNRIQAGVFEECVKHITIRRAFSLGVSENERLGTKLILGASAI